MTEEMSIKEFTEMFYEPLSFARLLYSNNRITKGDSWQDENVTSLKFLREKLFEELGEYFSGSFSYKELCDVLNMVLMLASRELMEDKKEQGHK